MSHGNLGMHPFVPLKSTCKGRFPFTLACPSFVYPADYVDNVRHLAPAVDEVQLLFFESRTPSLPSGSLIHELAEIAEREHISYNIHLPSDLSPGHPDPAQRHRAAAVWRQVIACCRPLSPSTYTLHLNRNPGDTGPQTLSQWRQHLLETLALTLPPDLDPRRLSVETLDYPFALVAPVITAANLSVCMDMGHLMVHDADIAAFFAAWQEHISIVHLHGIDGPQDHLPLDRLDRRRAGAVLEILNQFRGVVTLEVYSPEGLDASLAWLADHWQNDG